MSQVSGITRNTGNTSTSQANGTGSVTGINLGTVGYEISVSGLGVVKTGFVVIEEV
jgi:hypothetical protein